MPKCMRSITQTPDGHNPSITAWVPCFCSQPPEKVSSLWKILWVVHSFVFYWVLVIVYASMMVTHKKEIIKHHICEGNWPVCGWFPSQRASNAECISMSWPHHVATWWGHDMEMLSALLALCEGNPLHTGGFPSHMWCLIISFVICKLFNAKIITWNSADLLSPEPSETNFSLKNILKEFLLFFYFLNVACMVLVLCSSMC